MRIYNKIYCITFLFYFPKNKNKYKTLIKKNIPIAYFFVLFVKKVSVILCETWKFNDLPPQQKKNFRQINFVKKKVWGCCKKLITIKINKPPKINIRKYKERNLKL